MGVFSGKKGLIIGVANDRSIAWAIAEQVLAEGGECGFTHLPDRPDDERQKNRRRVAKLTESQAGAKFLVPMDATSDDDIAAVVARAGETFGRIDFLLHSIAFAPLEDLRVDTIETSREGFKIAMEISAYSLLAVANAARGIFSDRASIVTMTYFGGEKAVPGYNIMGVCKAALDASVRYLAYDLGPKQIRVNAISAGPLKTLSSSAVGEFDKMLGLYELVSPLGRNIVPADVGKTGLYLLSDLSAGVTGEILHVDAGYSIMGAPGRALERLQQGGGA